MNLINSHIYILAAKAATCTLIVYETSFKTVAKDFIIIICCFKQALNNSVLPATDTHSSLFSAALQTRKESSGKPPPSKHSPDREVTGCTTAHFLSKRLVWCPKDAPGHASADYHSSVMRSQAPPPSASSFGSCWFLVVSSLSKPPSATGSPVRHS